MSYETRGKGREKRRKLSIHPNMIARSSIAGSWFELFSVVLISVSILRPSAGRPPHVGLLDAAETGALLPALRPSLWSPCGLLLGLHRGANHRAPPTIEGLAALIGNRDSWWRRLFCALPTSPVLLNGGGWCAEGFPELLVAFRDHQCPVQLAVGQGVERTQPMPPLWRSAHGLWRWNRDHALLPEPFPRLLSADARILRCLFKMIAGSFEFRMSFSNFRFAVSLSAFNERQVSTLFKWSAHLILSVFPKFSSSCAHLVCLCISEWKVSKGGRHFWLLLHSSPNVGADTFL